MLTFRMPYIRHPRTSGRHRAAGSADPEQPALGAVQALEALFGDEHELADLNSGLLVGRDDVRLHDAGHSRLQGHIRKGSRRAAPRSEHGRKIAAAEPVHEVIVYSEAGVLDDAGGVDDLLHRGAVADD